MAPASQTSIFEYSDYRIYLADYYSNLLMIIKGTRNLSLKTIPKFAEGLKLGTKERKYFELMVLFNQTDDLQMKAKYFSEILAAKGSLKGLHDLEKEKFDFLSKWHVVAIYVLVDLADFKPDPAWIVKRLGGSVTLTQAKSALENLQKLGMLEPDLERGFRQISGAVTVADDTRSIAVFNYHQSMIRLAAEAMRRIPANQREMNGATVAIPLAKLPELKEKIRAFRKEINQLASSFENPDQVYQLNIQFFPLTTSEEK